MLKIIFLLTGGALGSLSRYLVSGMVHKAVSGTFPWGTLLVNTSGSFIIGICWGLFEMRDISPQTRMFIFIGFLGGYTTFSTYALESMNLLRDGDVGMATLNILLNNLLALVFVFAGYFLSKGLLTTLNH
jgi:CrcB protein